ncbi:MAG: histidine--tRNA ligase [Parachlamydiaceae bacterium]|nr:histidine--tRNA ligase [Parachlamydiaceae bacterium]
MTMNAPPGVFDILPFCSKEEWRDSYLWQHVEELIRTTARDYGYQEIRTPMFERTELFKRSVGDTSDIVSKEMYTFLDKGERSMSLRPEGTAPVIRAFIEHQLSQAASIHKLFYIAPMFRYERSQAGRYRQHHQFGAEAIGNGSPEQDVELIDLLYTLYQRLGLTNLELVINSIGDAASRKAYRDALQNYLRSFLSQLSADSQTRFETNPLRILDSKDPNDRKILENAPSILDYLNSESTDHFQAVQILLKQLNIPFTVSPKLVRGLDYYNKTVFEIVAGELGAQNSIGGGGRYDGLMKQLGGPDLPTIGFGTGIERIIQTLLKQNVPLPAKEGPILFLIALGDDASKACFTILHDLRKAGIAAQMDFGNKKLSKSMQLADQLKAKFVAVVGDDEMRTGEVNLKEMATGEITKAPLFHLTRILHIDATTDHFLSIWEDFNKPFTQPLEADFFIKRINNSIKSTSDLVNDLQAAAQTIKNLL